MPVPTLITDLSTTLASNSPAGTDVIGNNLDDYLRAAFGFIAQNYANKLALAGGTMTGALVLPDGAAATPSIAHTSDANTGMWFPAADTIAWSTAGVERLRIDSSGNVLGVSPAGLGYGTGAGGTVTQATSKSTTVTLNKPCGQITMNNAALAAGGEVAFTFNNSLITATDLVVIRANWNSGGVRSYSAEAYYTFAGGCYIVLRNHSAGSLSDAVALNFAIIKGATS